MPKKDLHLTTEQLSASIDGQLSPAEQVHSETHLKTCEQCRQALADLRLTVQALRSLPRPELPRSFALPASFGAAEQTEVAEVGPEPASPITTLTGQGRRSGITALPPLHRPKQPRRQPWPSYVTSTLRTASSLAAVVAIVLLLSSLLMSLPHFGGMGGSAASSTNGAAYGPIPMPPNDQQHTPPVNATTQANGNETAQAASTPAASPTAPVAGTPGADKQQYQADGQPTQSQNVTPIASWLAALNPLTASGQALSGALLLALAILGFLLLRLQRKRARGW